MSTGLVCFAAAALGLFLRAPDTLLNPQLIAEDASILFVDQLGHALPLLLVPYQGYLVMLGRSVAWIASPFAAVHIALVYNLAWLLLAAGSIAYFCVRARALFHPCASLTALLLLPLLGGELFGMVANVQWFGQLVVIAACLLPRNSATPHSTAWRAAQLALLAIFALNGPFAVLCAFIYFGLIFAQWVAARLRMTRVHDALSTYVDSLDEPSLAVVMAAGLIQMLVVASQGAIPAQHQAHLLVDFVQAAGGEGVQVHLLGSMFVGRTAFDWWQAGLLAAVLLWRLPASVRIGCLVLLGYGWLCLLGGYLKMKAVDMQPGDINYIDRYVFALVVFEWLILWRLLSAVPIVGELRGTLVLAGILAAIGFDNPVRIFRPPPRDLDWPAYARKIDAGEAVDVPINPVPWHFHVAARQKNR